MNFAFPLESDLPGIPGKVSDAAELAVPVSQSYFAIRPFAAIA